MALEMFIYAISVLGTIKNTCRMSSVLSSVSIPEGRFKTPGGPIQSPEGCCPHGR
jgi:hypothetical protein